MTYDRCDPDSHREVNANANSPIGQAAASSRQPGLKIALAVLAGLGIAAFLLLVGGPARRRFVHFIAQFWGSRPQQVIAQSRPRPNWGDRFDDGTPDFLRLSDPADRAAFRRWFTLIAEYEAARPKTEVPAEITDCASLLRYAYRETLKCHDESWFETTGIEVAAPPGEIREWSYPHTPLGVELFRVRPGVFNSGDVSDGAFAQFADAKTLVERNAYLLSHDVRAALPGDMLFYHQFGRSSPWHSMIVVQTGNDAKVVYDTGPDNGQPGELRRVLLNELLDHPEPQWRPLPGNPNFLGVYRWNILRGTE